MGDGIIEVGTIIGFLFFMILIFVAAYYATKFMGRHYSVQVSSSRDMRVIDKLMLGRDRYLLIVEVGEKTLLLGVSPQAMETLAEFESGVFGDAMPAQGATDFLSLLKSRLKKTED